MGDLAEAHAQLEAEGIGLAAISSDTAADSQALAERLSIEFPRLADPGTAVISGYGVKQKEEPFSLPATFVVRPDGVIAWEHVGEAPMDRAEVEHVWAEAARLRPKP